MDEHHRKLVAAAKHLERSGLPQGSHGNLIHALLTKFGVRVPPPHFCSFWFHFWSNALWFGPPYGIMMWHMQWKAGGMSAITAALLAVGAGVFMGAGMGAYYRFSFSKHSLPQWNEIT